MVFIGDTALEVAVESVGILFSVNGLLVIGLVDRVETLLPLEILRSKTSIALLGILLLIFVAPTACRPPALATIVSKSGHDMWLAAFLEISVHVALDTVSWRAVALPASLVRLISGDNDTFPKIPHPLLRLAVRVWPKPPELMPEVSD